MVRLVPMEAGEFGPYLPTLARDYAAEHVRTGRWAPEEGLPKTQEEIRQILRAGPETPNHYLFTIVAGTPEERVGMVGLAIEPRGGFVYDLSIREPHRRQGYAE